jgi:adenosylmethionine-8-amino-7-oxononanoate aminotransferase
MGLEVIADRATKRPFAPELKLNARIKAAGMERGLICYAMGGTIDGRLGDHVLLAPPFIVTDDEIEDIVGRLGDAVDAAIAAVASSAA